MQKTSTPAEVLVLVQIINLGQKTASPMGLLLLRTIGTKLELMVTQIVVNVFTLDSHPVNQME